MGFKNILLRQVGKRYKNVDFLKRNKMWVGLVFGLVGVYVWNFGCPGLETHCARFSILMTNLGSFLTGAGILDSDFRQKVAQGMVDKTTLNKLAQEQAADQEAKKNGEN